MEFHYDYNNLPFYSEEDVLLRRYITDFIAMRMARILRKQNKAWQFIQIEAPSLIPRDLVSDNYTEQDMFVQQVFDSTKQLVLKPETTPASYLYLENLLKSNGAFPPVCVWQLSKSFRREQDQPSKHCRYKEFYQQEFQCLYSADTMNNYQESCIEDIAAMFQELIALPTRIVLSDRLPAYSLKTMDVEVWNDDKWMEIASISLRKDFTYEPRIKSKTVPCLVLEMATSPDRITYNINQRLKVLKLNVERQT